MNRCSYTSSVMTTLAGLVPAIIGNLFDLKIMLVCAGFCLGIGFHQWVVTFSLYGLKGQP